MKQVQDIYFIIPVLFILIIFLLSSVQGLEIPHFLLLSTWLVTTKGKKDQDIK